MTANFRLRAKPEWAKALGAACLLVIGGAACALGAESDAVLRGAACDISGRVLSAPAKPAGAARAEKADPADKGDDGSGEPTKGEESGGGGKGVVINIESAEFEPWRLPSNYKNADGTWNEESLLAQQKKRLDFMNEKLSARLKLSETPHYLIYSDAPPAITSAFVKMCEALYGNLCKQFAIEPNERIWDGKCILLLFGSRSLFMEYSRVFDGHDATNAGAYFAWECNNAKLPQLVHICIPTDAGNLRRLQELFAHEGTHAFFQLYKKPVTLPLWLHEGLAEFMTVVNDPGLKKQKQEWAITFAKNGRSIDGILNAAPYSGFAYPAYNVSYTLVDFLLAGPGWKVKFKKFIELLKAGKNQDEALQAAYGFDISGLEERWTVYCRDVLGNNR